MNRFIKLNNFESIPGFYSPDPCFELEKIAVRQLQIKPCFQDSGEEILSIPFYRSGQWIPISDNEAWTIDLDKDFISISSKQAGILDGIALASDSIYHLWAMATKFGNLAGFGLFQQPTSTFQCASAAKGATITLTNLTKAYRFTVGSRIRIEHNNVTTGINDTDWNLATVTEILSTISLKATLDNDMVFQRTYGATIPVQGSTGGLVTQLDSYQPYIPDDTNQRKLYYYNRLIAILITDSSSNIDGFEKWPIVDPNKVGTIDFRDKDRGDCFPLITEDWQPYNGKSIKVDKSPLIGETLPDINSDNRYLRGANTSGILQAATSLATYPRNNTNEVQDRILNPDNTYNSGTLRAAATTTPSGNTYDEFKDFRPISMTAKIILKVR